MRITNVGRATGAVALGAGLLFGAGPAAAQELPDCDTGVLGTSYPPGAADSVGVSDASPLQDSVITATSGTGTFDPGSSVEVTFFSDPVPLGTVIADADGAARITFTVPATAEPGPHVLQFSGTRNQELSLVGVCLNVEPPVVLSETITRPAPAPAAAPSTPSVLPFTGSMDLATVSLLGAGLVGLGVVSVVVARRRKRDLPA